MKTMKNYHDLHLKSDVLPLTYVFEKFRNNSLKNYGLYPSHYLSAPTLKWDVMLNMRKVELELIPDPEMYIVFEKGMRDGSFKFLIDIVKPTISIWNLMTQSKNQNIL